MNFRGASYIFVEDNETFAMIKQSIFSNSERSLYSVKMD